MFVVKTLMENDSLLIYLKQKQQKNIQEMSFILTIKVNFQKIY